MKYAIVSVYGLDKTRTKTVFFNGPAMTFNAKISLIRDAAEHMIVDIGLELEAEGRELPPYFNVSVISQYETD